MLKITKIQQLKNQNYTSRIKKTKNSFKAPEQIKNGKENFDKEQYLKTRLQNSKGAQWGNPFLQTDKTKIRQLNSLSKEQLEAMDDKLIDSLVRPSTNTAIKNFELLKSLTPEQIIKIEQNPCARIWLFHILSGTYRTEEHLKYMFEQLTKEME